MKHGADIYRYALQAGHNADEIIDFSSNINTHCPVIDITLTDSMLVKYAESSYSELKKTIADTYKVKKSQISLYNGATSAIMEILRELEEKDVYLYAPLYGEYEKAAHISKKNVIKINRFKELDTKPTKNSIVVFVNPSTPDGKYYDLKELFELWKKQNCTVILDESFLEFEELKSYRDEINSYNNLYIIQSFSKFFSCAGVRIGAIFSNKQNIKNLHTPLWNLSSFDVEFLTQRLKDKKFVTISKVVHKKNKQQLRKILNNSKLFSKVYESDANFFLVKSKDSCKIFKHLLEHKILVRTCGSFDFLNNNYLRFAVKDSDSHKALKEALKSINLNK
jgi:threonine-phosphate decarboxylase